jgi:small ligand-binding sensory domain FIST
MKWANALSSRPSLEAAVEDVIQQTQTALGTSADLAIVFISNAYASEFTRLMPLLRERLQVPHLIGCGGNGIIGIPPNGTVAEIEEDPAIALTLAQLPGVKIHPFHISGDDLPDPDSPPQRWVDLMGIDPADNPQFVLLADSSTAKVKDLLQGLDYAYPAAAKIGGLTSGSSMFGGSALFCDFQLHRIGTIGLALSGNIVLDTIVAQGCRPIGPVYRVTEAERHIALKVEVVLPAMADQRQGGEWESEGVMTPLEALEEVLDNLEDRDRELAQQALSVGIASTEFKQTLGPGDFLIRDLIGVDPKVGAIAIGDRIRSGQRIQFHLRDAQAAADELENLLLRYCSNLKTGETSPAGSLVFDCLGRGERFYGVPNVDSQLLRQYFPQIPLAGFFCFGEIGPIGGATYLHGYTAAFGIFRSLA